MKTVRIAVLSFLYGVRLCGQVFDQGYDSSATGGVFIDRQQQPAQTFTVGIEGFLTEVRLDLFRTSASQQDLWLMITKPDDQFYYAIERIDTTTVPVGAENAAMVSVPISAVVPMEVNEEWSIHLFGHQNANYVVSWINDAAAPYTRGIGYIYSGDTGATAPTNRDFSFLTFMNPQSVTETPIPLGLVPEPSTYALCFGAGLAGWAMWRRGRQKTAKER